MRVEIAAPPQEDVVVGIIGFAGRDYRVREVSGAVLADFGEVAMGGAAAEGMEGVAAIKDLMRDCILPEEFADFWRAVRAARLPMETLMSEVVVKVIQVASERPTGRPSDSSAGPTTTQPRSEPDSSSRVIARLEENGRPDLALVVAQAQGLTA
jgi:hypothetical protein